MSTNMETDSPIVEVSDVLEIIDEVEEEVVAEDKTGATREMVATGTCARIQRRLLDLPAEADR